MFGWALAGFRMYHGDFIGGQWWCMYLLNSSFTMVFGKSFARYILTCSILWGRGGGKQNGLVGAFPGIFLSQQLDVSLTLIPTVGGASRQEIVTYPHSPRGGFMMCCMPFLAIRPWTPVPVALHC
ncbi:unnamed protein product [Ostreobium quekettii]|uniref:Uncharacterized protein n=1 Tax=Ostreobium quekettii TaxID=121088 RepID=A0A8S1IK06_9CHLO|nr:unnamed protein product [Ostreobium quekettii]